MIWFSDFCFLAARANLWKDLWKKSGEIEVIRVNPLKNSYNESYNLLERPQIPPTINSNSIPSPNTALWKINKAYLWPRSKGWMRALKASIQPAATKVTNMLCLFSRGRLLCLRQIPIYWFNIFFICLPISSGVILLFPFCCCFFNFSSCFFFFFSNFFWCHSSVWILHLLLISIFRK